MSAPVTGSRLRLSGLARWEMLLVLILIGLLVAGNRLSPHFLTGQNFANLVSAIMEIASSRCP